MRFPVLTVLAVYGAVLSSVTALVQILNHRRDRAKIALTVRKNMATAGMDRRYGGMTLVIITATNVGRRPVTIQGFSAHLLCKGQEHTDWWLSDVRPTLPHEITEGREVSCFVNQANVNFDLIAYWDVWDSVGGHYRLNVARWNQRLISKWRWRHRPQHANVA